MVIIGFCGIKKDFKNEGDIKKLIKNLGLEKDVFFLGYQKNPFKYVKKAKLYVFTSLHEGLPRAVIESLIVGTPVVGFTNKYADLEEIFGKGSKVLVEYPNVDKLAEKIIYILKNEKEYQKIKNETFQIAEKFSTENTVNQYLNLINSLKEGNC